MRDAILKKTASPYLPNTGGADAAIEFKEKTMNTLAPFFAVTRRVPFGAFDALFNDVAASSRVGQCVRVPLRDVTSSVTDRMW